ncbi:MAG TPA: type II toxin-antitoxin system HicB family antitoxin [Methanothrix sp.]|nr:type II toxin-antitoxin system HicB family antitoxin [Methanothrix sp.]HRW83000.1 type II toxin-antitoxin system HicB family antitoxin [Methanothrix sp.]
MVEYLVSLKIEKLEEGVYLATSDDLQGLVAQGRTISDTVEIAQDVAKNLIESLFAHGDPLPDGIAPATKPVKNLEIPVTVSV